MEEFPFVILTVLLLSLLGVVISSIGLLTSNIQLKKIRKNIKLSEIKLKNLNKKTEIFKDFKKIIDECQEDNWDGQGSKKRNHESVMKSLSFLGDFPDEIEPPEIAIDPDGEISFDWYVDSNHILSLSMGEKISYAMVCGDEKTHGTIEYKKDDEIPYEILDMLEKLKSE